MRVTATVRRGLWIRRIAAALCFALLTPPVLAAQTATQSFPGASAQSVLRFTHAEAVRADWDSVAPPVSGWIPVHLTDMWTTQWPRHNGVVWYRLRWDQRDAQPPLGLLLDYVSLADAVYVNGSLIHRDPHLREPLSRSWIKPQYFLLDAPLLRAGKNTVLVRVSGLAAYEPGLGTVSVGDPRVLHARYERGVWLRSDMRIFDLTTDIVLATLFGLLWLMRRKDTLYGWFALASLCGAAYSWNFVASSPWPFASTDAWMALHTALHMAMAASFALFLLRYGDVRWPWIERFLLIVAALALGCALALPHWFGPWRVIWQIPAMITLYAAILGFIIHALRSRRTELLIPAGFLILPILAAVHDNLVQAGVIAGETFLSDLTSPVTLIGVSFVLAYRFVVAMRRVERFNLELAHEIETATDELRATLQREQALGMTNARIHERLNLVRDLHDGFGGSLLGAIAELECGPDGAVRDATAQVLRDLRDDLRLVIDTTTHATNCDLAELLAPLRHRCTQRLELAGIASDWHCEGLDGLKLDTARSLDVLRLLQEALTNVLKHSGASRVGISMRRANACLQVEVRDDGRGFTAAASPTHLGAGLASLRARAARLGCALEILSEPGQGACVRCTVEIRAKAA
jgi:signal transduction histidine kinase